MAEKTELIELLLDQRMVKFHSRRIERHPASCLNIQHESVIDPHQGREREVYTVSAILHSRFYRLPNEPEAARNQRYHRALHALADVMYGEIRRELSKLWPLTVEIDYLEQREAMETIMNRLDNMMRVD